MGEDAALIGVFGRGAAVAVATRGLALDISQLPVAAFVTAAVSSEGCDFQSLRTIPEPLCPHCAAAYRRL